MFARGKHTHSFWSALGICMVGLIVLYACGSAWLGFSTGLGLRETLTAGVLPFVLFDSIKILIAVAIGLRVRQSLHKANLLAAR